MSDSFIVMMHVEIEVVKKQERINSNQSKRLRDTEIILHRKRSTQVHSHKTKRESEHQGIWAKEITILFLRTIGLSNIFEQNNWNGWKAKWYETGPNSIYLWLQCVSAWVTESLVNESHLED